MAMKIPRDYFLDSETVQKKSFESIAAKMALDFEAEVFQRMKKLNLKQKDVAELLGISPAAVSKMLSNSSNLTLKTIAKFAEALGCSVAPICFNPLSEAHHVDYFENAESVSAIATVSGIGCKDNHFVLHANDHVETKSATSETNDSGSIDTRGIAA